MQRFAHHGLCQAYIVCQTKPVTGETLHLNYQVTSWCAQLSKGTILLYTHQMSVSQGRRGDCSQISCEVTVTNLRLLVGLKNFRSHNSRLEPYVALSHMETLDNSLDQPFQSWHHPETFSTITTKSVCQSNGVRTTLLRVSHDNFVTYT